MVRRPGRFLKMPVPPATFGDAGTGTDDQEPMVTPNPTPPTPLTPPARSRRIKATFPLLSLLVAPLALAGCEMDSFLDPSVVGRWERTPVTIPILSRLDVIDEEDEFDVPVSDVQPVDLIPDVQEYVIGPGDLITVDIFELIVPGQSTVQSRRVDETGSIRLPVVGTVQAAGRSPSQLEQDIVRILEEKGVLRDATVSVVLQQSRQNIYSVVSEANFGGTSSGTYVIPKPDFRLLEAIALARGVPGRTKDILIIRQSPLSDEAAGVTPGELRDPSEQPTRPTPQTQGDLIDTLLNEGNGGTTAPRSQTPTPAPREDIGVTPEQRPAAPSGVATGLDDPRSGVRYVEVNGEWVRVGQNTPSSQPSAVGEDTRAMGEEQQRLEELGMLITQRIIEVPYDRLINGDMRYNVVIRPGDVIKVPAPSAGFVYIMGPGTQRPGAYTVPGEEDLTLKQLVASSGGMSGIANPERVDLVRRIGDNQEAIVRLNIRAIFEGTEPDIFLKPNDLINVGTDFTKTPLAVFRNGLRATYGFGFILDRNFGPDVFGDN